MYASLLALLANGCILVFVEEWTSLDDVKTAQTKIHCDGILCTTKIRLISLLHSPFRTLKWLNTKYKNQESSIKNEVALVESDDAAIISFSSGTTQASKAIVRTHGIVNAQFIALQQQIVVTDNAMMCTNFPVVILMNLGLGICTFISTSLKISKLAETDFIKLSQEINKHPVTHLSFSPFVLYNLSKAFDKSIKFQQVICGGSSLFPSRIKEISAKVITENFTVLYGSSEAEPIAYCSAWEAIANAEEKGLFAGRIDQYAKVKILKEENGTVSICEAEEPGEIIVTGPHVVKSYVASEEAFKQNKIVIEGEVWHRTGDCGYFNANGNLFLTGPLKYLQNGFFLSEIEKQLTAIEGVLFGTILNGKAYIQKNKSGKSGQIENRIMELFPWVNQIVFRNLPLDKRHNGKIKYRLLSHE